jgi:peptidoglycan/xylan/chitin deacetylase (PgdA/CDA1 family)
MPDFGAFVISLDFELHWGVRDHCRPGALYRRTALESRRTIPRILDLFEEFEISATWATVGMLFACSRRELEESCPLILPEYETAAVNPYLEPVGESEDDDPLHYAPAIIREIRSRAGQEIASHTFSHYCSLEPGHDKHSFAADVKAAVAIAAKQGITLRSLVFPRDQINPEFLDVLPSLGIIAYRGARQSWMYCPAEKSRQRGWARRGTRLLDAYIPLSGRPVQDWNDMLDDRALWNVRAGAYLRPYNPALAALEPLRLRRLSRALELAALSNRIFHLWFHPHDFGAYPEQNLRFLRAVCVEYARWRDRAGLRSMNMGEAVAANRSDSDKRHRFSWTVLSPSSRAG